MSSYSDLKDKVVIITGGANGIGRSMVEAFRQQEAIVEFCDLDTKAGKSLAKTTGSCFCKVDLTKPKEIESWTKEIVQRNGQVDCLINNAARDPRIALSNMTINQWDDLFALNIRAFVLMTKQIAPHMPRRGGSIINFSSITFHLSPAEMSAYVSTKAGIIGLTRSLARELGPQHIRVNTLAPGWIMTERQMKEFVTPAVKRMLKKEQCIPELIQPEEIANVALFLASTASSAITGQEILVDRGWAHH